MRVKNRELFVARVGLILGIGFMATSVAFAWYSIANPNPQLTKNVLDLSNAFMVIIGLWIALGRRWAKKQNAPVKPLIEAEAERDTAIRRRRDAKRWNESIKLLANGLNAIGASSFLALAVVPMINERDRLGASALYGLAIAVVCHLGGQLVLRLWKTEE